MLHCDPEQPVIISHARRLSALAAISRLQGLSLHCQRLSARVQGLTELNNSGEMEARSHDHYGLLSDSRSPVNASIVPP